MQIQTQQVDYRITLDDINYGLPFREYAEPGKTTKYSSVYMKCYNSRTKEKLDKVFVIDLRDGYAVDMPNQTKVFVIDAMVVENVVKKA